MAQNTESVVAKPLVFNGSLSSYPTWRRSLGLYMTFNSTKFPDDQSKVIYALSYMTEGTANVWAQAFYEEKMDTAGTLVVGTWADFVVRLEATFRDTNLQRNAADTLLRKRGVLDIDNGGPEKFFAEYESLSRDANMVTSDASHDAVHLNNPTRLMPPDLRDRLSYKDPQPGTYAEFKRMATQLYPSYKEKKDRHLSRALPGEPPRAHFLPPLQEIPTAPSLPYQGDHFHQRKGTRGEGRDCASGVVRRGISPKLPLKKSRYQAQDAIRCLGDDTRREG